MINIRKLVALDISLHGYTFIISEFFFGVIAAFIIGFLSLKIQPYLGYYIISLGINYVPLLLFAIDMKLKNSAEKESKGEMKRVYKYTIQQFVIFIPFSMILLVALQRND
ncbi:MAG: hypothetical protein ACHQX1_00060 [Candidatus Micrarchaeales archaeon]